MPEKPGRPKIVDSEGLSDADWVEVNRLLRAYDAGGNEAFWQAMDKLGEKDPIQQIAIAGAFYPDVVREVIKDEMAEQGMTEEDVRELHKKLKQRIEGGADTKH